jgi:TolA-binding protein
MIKYPHYCIALALCVSSLPSLAQSPEEQLAAASALFDAGNYAASAQKLDAFLAKNPKHPKAGPAALALGRCRSQLKQFEKAIPAYEKAVASKDPAVVPMAELGLGEAAMYTRQFEKAANALSVAVKSPLTPQQAPVVWCWLGQARFQRKQYAAAAEAYNRVIKDYGRSDVADDAYFGAGLVALRQGDRSGAQEKLRAVADRYPDSADRPQSLLLLAQMELDAKHYQEARSGFEAILQDPKAKSVQRDAEDGLIQALLALGDYDAAASRLQSALSRLSPDDPQRYRAELSLGNCRYRQKQYQPALSAYLEAGKSKEDAVAAQGCYWAGNAALSLNRPADAAAQFAQFLARFPKSDLAPRAQRRAGDALLAANRNADAAKAYQAVLTDYPQSPEAEEARKALVEMADSLSDPAQRAAVLKHASPAEQALAAIRTGRKQLAAQQFTQAAQTLEEAQKAKPEGDTAAEVNYLLGVAYEGQQKAAPAAAALAQAVTQRPKAEWAADAQSRLAWLYLTLKQPAEVEKAATAALALNPPAPIEQQARLALVQLRMNQEQWDAALDECRRLMENHPSPETTVSVLYAQAWVNDKRGKPEEAQPLWERLVAEYPKSAYAAAALLQLGDASMKAEKYDDAKAKYEKLLADYPKSPLVPAAHFKLGSALYNLNRPAEAATQFETAADDKAAGDYAPEALYWAGIALDKAGKKAEAIRRLDQFVTQYPDNTHVKNAKVRLAALKATR